MSQRPEHAPETQATQFLKAHKVAFSSHLYAYEEHGGTKVSARELNVDENAVVKTLIFEDEQAKIDRLRHQQGDQNRRHQLACQTARQNMLDNPPHDYGQPAPARWRTTGSPKI